MLIKILSMSKEGEAINQLMKTHICPNIKNSDGLTVMDILGNQTLLSDRDKMKIQHLSRRKLHLPTARKNLGSPTSCRELFGIQFSRVTKISSEKRNALLVVDPLIATVTYQAALSPPGGVWKRTADINSPIRTNVHIDNTSEANPSSRYVGTVIMSTATFRCSGL
ncbi:hypothetical protein GH714_035454 [Hevea brasiliensis]|uniref:PGG domain-containing protein n=1 Tax=Hevea brasiliensis TaxID=3981 RepID=A0A6A6L3M3_HEVBR|nr:hypothetical protein GH714_035454 [Hevea brasiliensis]